MIGSIFEHLEHWENLVAALGALLVGAAGWAVKVWRSLKPLRIRKRHEDRALRFLRTVHETADAMARWVEASGALRGVLVMAQNCEFVAPVKPVRLSVVCESAPDDVPRIFERWQEQRADTSHLQVLHDVLSQADSGCGVLLIADDLPTGVLRDFYTENGICASVVFYVAMTAHAEMLYVSLNFGCVEHEVDSMDKAVANAKALHESPERVRRMAMEARRIWKHALT
jgi:hypothetical protein